MRPGRRGVTIVIQRDGATTSRTIRLRPWVLRLGGIVASIAGVALLVGAALYGPVVRTAARVPGLERQVARLEADNAKVRELSAALDSVESRYHQVRQMIGGDVVRDPLTAPATLPLAPPITAHAATATREGPGPSVPHRWPLDEPGYLTRGQVGAGAGDEAHPGIDIAIAVGNLVRAAGGGDVRRAGEDPQYGLFALVEHPEGYETMYGHLSRVVVTPGAAVSAGDVIGLTGNSGRSSAPHLHFEVRQRGTSLDPLTLVKENR
jgi:murein DD-endopeptidase MepM/ murein hydrolase activator NlpD